MEKRRFLVTGGAGYVGSHVVRELLLRGDEVVVLDNLSTGHRAAVQRADFVLGDVRDARVLRALFACRRVDCVLHFAALSQVGESMTRPIDYYDHNVTGTLTLLKAMRDSAVFRIIFSSSAAVYGEPETSPIVEDARCAPSSPYGRSKRMAEMLLADACSTSDLKCLSLRYFNAAGASPAAEIGEDHDPETHLIPLVLQTALGLRPQIDVYGTDWGTPDGTCVRDYVHVSDLAQAHLLAADRLFEGGDSDVLNVGTGVGLSVREIIRTARYVTGAEVPERSTGRRPGDPAQLVACGRKIRDVLGWRPSLSDPETIIRTAWEWCRANPRGFEEAPSDRGLAELRLEDADTLPAPKAAMDRMRRL